VAICTQSQYIVDIIIAIVHVCALAYSMAGSATPHFWVRQSTESRPNKSMTITVVHWSNFFNQTQPNPLQSENFGRTNQPNPQPNRTPHNQQQTFAHKEYNLGALFHRNMMTVSKTPVNTYDNCQ